MPNLSPDRPVLILSCVNASTSGFTRSATAATRPAACATADSIASSSALSTLIWPTPAASAAPSSSRRLPTPENTTSPGAIPARNARANSPPLTTSAPAPPARISDSTARWSFAFTA